MSQLIPAVAVNCCSLHSIRVRTATTAQYWGADCNNSTVSVRTAKQHTIRQLSATTACTISLRSATVSESHQTGFTSRRQTVKIL